MRKLLFVVLILAPAADCDTPDEQDQPAVNVNSRYTVESVQVTGRLSAKVSESLRSDMDKVVGEKLDHGRLETLADRLKKELRVSDVAIKVNRGASPDHVVVNFEVQRPFEQRVDLHLTRFIYHSKQGWTGQGSVGINVHGNMFRFGLVSDNDSLSERFAGVRSSYERERLGTDRLGLRFVFSSYHQQYNQATLRDAAPSDIYRNRESFAPEFVIRLSAPLELSAGTDFERYRLTAGSERTESSNAVVTTLRYHQRWGTDKDQQEQDLRGSYSLRAGTGVLESDRAYSRHAVEAHYRFRHAHNTVDVGFLGGRIGGSAPLYERFVLGNASTLRGWNKFDLVPAGASRVAHGSVQYNYRGFFVFYDTGAVWDRPSQREQKQSLGVGFKIDVFELAVAFPLRSGAANPVFYTGLNF